jgi:CRP-like cAMP-binding protein
VSLAESYGESSDRGTRIYNIEPKDLADVSDISPEEAQKILMKLIDKKWLEIDEGDDLMYLTNTKQLAHLAGHMG